MAAAPAPSGAVEKSTTKAGARQWASEGFVGGGDATIGDGVGAGAAMTRGAGGGAGGAGVGRGGVGAGWATGVWARASRPLARPLNTIRPNTAAPPTPTHTLHGESGARTRGRAASPWAKTGLTSLGA